MNRALEPRLMRHHGVKRWLRGIYNRIDETNQVAVIEESAKTRIANYCRSSIVELHAWIQMHDPSRILPTWLAIETTVPKASAIESTSRERQDTRIGR